MTADKQKQQESKEEVMIEDLPVEETREEEVKGGGWLASPAGS